MLKMSVCDELMTVYDGLKSIRQPVTLDFARILTK
jgi:hypothetical protein